MSDNEILKELERQTALLATVVNQLAELTRAEAPVSPCYLRRLSEYSRFDWATIGAVEVSKDRQGVVEVEWNGHRFFRRNGSGKFGTAIWFSRPLGQTEDGTEYAVLIRFKDREVEALGRDVVEAANRK